MGSTVRPCTNVAARQCGWSQYVEESEPPNDVSTKSTFFHDGYRDGVAAISEGKGLPVPPDHPIYLTEYMDGWLAGIEAADRMFWQTKQPITKP